MNYKGAITEEYVLDAIEGIFMVDADKGRDSTFTIQDVAWIISDVHPTYPDMETAIRSTRWHLGRLKRKGCIIKIGNAEPHTRGRPHAIYKRTPEGARLTDAYEEKWRRKNLSTHTC